MIFESDQKVDLYSFFIACIVRLPLAEFFVDCVYRHDTDKEAACPFGTQFCSVSLVNRRVTPRFTTMRVCHLGRAALNTYTNILNC